LSRVLPSRLTRIHKSTGDALEVSVDEMEVENAMLKERVKELEYALIPPPIFASLTLLFNLRKDSTEHQSQAQS
jgi:hypothetical protein